MGETANLGDRRKSHERHGTVIIAIFTDFFNTVALC